VAFPKQTIPAKNPISAPSPSSGVTIRELGCTQHPKGCSSRALALGGSAPLCGGTPSQSNSVVVGGLSPVGALPWACTTAWCPQSLLCLDVAPGLTASQRHSSEHSIVPGCWALLVLLQSTHRGAGGPAWGEADAGTSAFPPQPWKPPFGASQCAAVLGPVAGLL